MEPPISGAMDVSIRGDMVNKKPVAGDVKTSPAAGFSYL